MAKMIVGVLDTSQEARTVVEELITNGFSREAIGFLARDFRTVGKGGASGQERIFNQGAAVGALAGLIGLVEKEVAGIGQVIAAGPLAAAVAGATGGSRSLAALGIPEVEADYFAESVANGSTLISVTTDNDSAERAADIIRRQGVSAEERERLQREARLREERPERARAERLPVERPASQPAMAVSTPAPPSGQGGVHIYNQVYETPAEQQLRMREERAGLDVRPEGAKKGVRTEEETPGQRASREEPARQEPRMETAERGGEPPAKSPHLRRGEEEKPAERPILGREKEPEAGSGPLLRAEDDDFRRHFRNAYGKQGERYRDYRSAYYYADSRSSDEPYRGKEWAEVEEEIHREWDRTHPGTWSRFREALHFAWDRSRHRGH